ncbi:Gfo/Idh/MocA family protein [Paraglaciecola arctica]|nr:Gfo/Idh/MocA family oxidoreductase [Paraglaciecola arctica]
MGNKMIRMGLIGLGDIAQKAYLPVLATMDGVTPVLCTRNSNVLARLVQTYGLKEGYTDISDLIRANIDGAMVHTSTEHHVEIIEKLLQAGIPTFVDKPVSYNLSETERVLELSSNRNLPFFVGFNRRYAPLISSIDETNPVQIKMQKNRVNLPAPQQTFIYDDFIHVLDTLRFLSKGKIEQLHVFGYYKEDLLASIDVNWQSGQTMVCGSMNRICGVEEEKLELFGQQQKWIISRLSQGWHYTPTHKSELSFGDWDPTLFKRGFVTMLQTFIKQVEMNKSNTTQLDDILKTHQLCEQVLSATLKNNG